VRGRHSEAGDAAACSMSVTHAMRIRQPREKDSWRSQLIDVALRQATKRGGYQAPRTSHASCIPDTAYSAHTESVPALSATRHFRRTGDAASTRPCNTLTVVPESFQ
jgi:hypothetical protein